MLTREKLLCGEGNIFEENPLIGLRKRNSQIENMASKEGLSLDEKEFRKTFFAMSEMMKVLYEDYLERKRPNLGEYSKGKSKKERILLKFLLHLHHHLLLLLLQVQVLNPMQRNMFINIRTKCLYLNLMLNSNYPCMMVKLM
jgi:hypothetical protein